LVVVFPLPSHEVYGAPSSDLVVKEEGEEGIISSPFGGSSVTPAVNKDDDVRLTGLIQSQKWPVGFGSTSEMVVWDQGDDLWDEEIEISLTLWVYALGLGLGL
jgi:hypothetical protein